MESELYIALQNFTSIFEQYFSITDQPRTSHYKNNNGVIEPVFETDFIKPTSNILFKANVEACLDYCKYAKNFITAEYSIIISRIILSKFLDSLHKFNKNTLSFFESFEISENEFEKKVLLKRLSCKELWHHDNIMWFTGSLIFTFGRAPYYLLRLKSWFWKIIFK